MQGNTAGAGAADGVGSGASTSAAEGWRNKQYISFDFGSQNTACYFIDWFKQIFSPSDIHGEDGQSYPGVVETVVAVKWSRDTGHVTLEVNRNASDGMPENFENEIVRLVRHFKLLMAGKSSSHEQAEDFTATFKDVNGVQHPLMPQCCERLPAAKLHLSLRHLPHPHHSRCFAI